MDFVSASGRALGRSTHATTVPIPFFLLAEATKSSPSRPSTTATEEETRCGDAPCFLAPTCLETRGARGGKQQHIGLFCLTPPAKVPYRERVDNVGETGWRVCAVLLLSGGGKLKMLLSSCSIDDQTAEAFSDFACMLEARRDNG